MIEKDDEDLWFECLAFVEAWVPRNHSKRVHMILLYADQLYDRCKAKTKKLRKEKDPQATVVQLK